MKKASWLGNPIDAHPKTRAAYSRLVRSFALTILCLRMVTQHAASQELTTKPKFLPLYQFVVELNRVTQKLPKDARLSKIELKNQELIFQGSLSPEDASAFAAKLPVSEASRWREAYAVAPLAVSVDRNGFDMRAKISQGFSLPEPIQGNQASLDATYLLRIREHAFAEGIDFDILKWQPVGGDNKGLSRFTFATTTTYKKLISWLLNTPSLSESLIDRLSIIKKNSTQITIQGEVYVGDLILTLMQNDSIRGQIQQAQTESLPTIYPFNDADTYGEPKEQLNDFSVVRVLLNGRENIALMKDKKMPNLLLTRRVGNYLGTQQWRIVAINEKNVEISEVVRSDDGKEYERRSFLPVQQIQ